MRSGGFRSVFRGNGIEFEEVRRYESGDDARLIDRNVSARFGSPFVRTYREERELAVFAALDCSASMFACAGGPVSRFEQALLAMAVIGFSAVKAGQRFGAVLFDEAVRQVWKPTGVASRLPAIVSAAIGARPRGSGSALDAAERVAGRVLKRRGLVALISDFRCEGWEAEIGGFAGRHDFIALRISDPFDYELPKLGLVPLEDPESGAAMKARTGSPAFRKAWREWNEERRGTWEAACRRLGLAHLELSTEDDTAAALRNFFKKRGRAARS